MSENEAITSGLGGTSDVGNSADAADVTTNENTNNPADAADGVQDGADVNPPSNDGEDANDAFGAPENYDFKDVSLPEGFQIDNELAAKFAPLGKELNLSQQSANKLANLLVEYQQQQLASVNEKFADYKKQEEQAIQLSYEKLLNTDKEIGGGNAAKMNAFIDVADVGYNSFASDELKSVLHKLHLDYHPAVIKHFHRLGKLCGNDSITKTGSPSGVKQDAADILYAASSKSE